MYVIMHAHHGEYSKTFRLRTYEIGTPPPRAYMGTKLAYSTILVIPNSQTVWD